MKNRKYNRIPAILLILFTVLAMFGCQKNFSYNYENNPVQTPNGTGYNINADISFSASTSSEEKNQEDEEEEKEQDVQDKDADSESGGNAGHEEGNGEIPDFPNISNDKDNGADKETVDSNISENVSSQISVEENGEYSSKDEVALYIHTYGHLPSNYITKNEAKNLGWDSSKGNLWDVAPGKSIGGDKFGNREGLLPKADKRQYYECDIDFDGGYRNEKRIIYSNDGLIYYTGDHYNSFTQLY